MHVSPGDSLPTNNLLILMERLSGILAQPVRPLILKYNRKSSEHVENADVSVLEDKEVLSINDNGGACGFVFQAATVRKKRWSGAYAVCTTG